jgi:predicted lipid-binding transport protein (Tim44 family)
VDNLEQDQMTKSTSRAVNPRTAAATTSSLHNISAFMGGLISSIAAGASVWIGKFIASLHETRRQQARYTIDRYRHLVNDDDKSSSHSR